MSDTSFPRHRIRITLLENVHPSAAQALTERGYSVDVIPRALEGTELAEVVAASHVLGVRSRTKVREEALAHAGRMLAIGCFSVGTDQVAIRDAARRGIPVFNAPHASTRSVAELTMGAMIALARRLSDWLASARPAQAGGDPDSAVLLAANLAGAAVRGDDPHLWPD